ncbi:Galactan beta-1,4-galactosyltransferase GALS3 [Glycine soja]|uniref:Glycosyltransferase family 92 protein n=2 Tax=Glycine subgen. Soja TaxID=1462606 RepID=K7L947_SOYBN|nr:Galactan beta-1,4-galactosyltransferase GALS3 [Glycine soja]
MYTKKKQHNTKQNKTFPDPEPHLPPLMKRESKFERKHVHNATELKLLLATLLLLCSVATLLQFIPLRFTNISPSNLHLCISSVSQQPPPPFTSHSTLSPSSSSNTPLSTPSSTQLLPNGTIKRAFIPYGSAAYNFITMGAYRGGTNTFAIVGLSSKPLHVYGKPTYECEWIPFSSPKPIITMGYKIIPDIWGYDHVYTAVVVNCTFNHTIINGDNNGGKLVLYASTSGAGDTNFNLTDRIEVLQEAPNTLDVSLFVSEPKYDYFYCGSPLYGDLSPQRVREWITYHVWLFGPRSHFVIYDAGGVHEEVLEVLKPWMELGFVTLQDIRDQERFDGYLHNQFMVVNDCLHRYKFMAKWMFFFDVDEYIYVPPNNTIKTVVDSLSKYDQFIFNMMPMNNKICLYEDYGKTCRKQTYVISYKIRESIQSGLKKTHVD